MSGQEKPKPRIDVINAGFGRQYLQLSLPPGEYKDGELKPYLEELCTRAKGRIPGADITRE